MKNEILSAVFLFSFAGLVTFSGYTESISDTPAITIPVASEPISTDETSATKKTGTKPIVATANQSIGKIMVLDFPLDELTDLPNHLKSWRVLHILTTLLNKNWLKMA
jgi:hypothetical protein